MCGLSVVVWGVSAFFLRVAQGMRHAGGSFAVEIKKTQDYDS